jgi:hypothetical protein
LPNSSAPISPRCGHSAKKVAASCVSLVVRLVVTKNPMGLVSGTRRRTEMRLCSAVPQTATDRAMGFERLEWIWNSRPLLHKTRMASTPSSDDEIDVVESSRAASNYGCHVGCPATQGTCRDGELHRVFWPSFDRPRRPRDWAEAAFRHFSACRLSER